MTNVHSSTETNRLLLAKYESSVETMRPIREQILRTVLDGIPKEAAVLDVGHGIGENLSIMQGWGYSNAWGIDIDPEMLQPARARACRNLIEGDVLALDPLERRYEVVFAQAFLHIYPKSKVRGVLERLLALSTRRVYASVKVHAEPSEGVEQRIEGVERFRARYTWDEFEGMVTDTVLPRWRARAFPLTDPLGRKWLNVVIDAEQQGQ